MVFISTVMLASGIVQYIRELFHVAFQLPAQVIESSIQMF